MRPSAWVRLPIPPQNVTAEFSTFLLFFHTAPAKSIGAATVFCVLVVAVDPRRAAPSLKHIVGLNIDLIAGGMEGEEEWMRSAALLY